MGISPTQVMWALAIGCGLLAIVAFTSPPAAVFGAAIGLRSVAALIRSLR